MKPNMEEVVQPKKIQKLSLSAGIVNALYIWKQLVWQLVE